MSSSKISETLSVNGFVKNGTSLSLNKNGIPPEWST